MYFHIIVPFPLTAILQLINITASFFCLTSIYAAWHIGIALSSHFVVSALSALASVGVVLCCHHALYSGQYLKNGLSD